MTVIILNWNPWAMHLLLSSNMSLSVHNILFEAKVWDSIGLYLLWFDKVLLEDVSKRLFSICKTSLGFPDISISSEVWDKVIHWVGFLGLSVRSLAFWVGRVADRIRVHLNETELRNEIGWKFSNWSRCSWSWSTFQITAVSV